MIGITVAEPIVPIYLDKAAVRKLKMKEGQGKIVMSIIKLITAIIMIKMLALKFPIIFNAYAKYCFV